MNGREKKNKIEKKSGYISPLMAVVPSNNGCSGFMLVTAV